VKRLAFLVLSVLVSSASAADKIRIGFISTLSGPNASIGIDIRDAFNLAIKLNGGRLGGLPAEVLASDDQLKPENAKQIAERYLRLEKVDFITGPVFSNVVVAIAPDVIAAKTFFIAPNAGPALYSGAQCNPFFFVSSCRRSAPPSPRRCTCSCRAAWA
jgi:branched-chain amino acid transport system substrate-binding protein